MSELRCPEATRSGDGAARRREPRARGADAAPSRSSRWDFRGRRAVGGPRCVRPAAQAGRRAAPGGDEPPPAASPATWRPCCPRGRAGPSGTVTIRHRVMLGGPGGQRPELRERSCSWGLTRRPAGSGQPPAASLSGCRCTVALGSAPRRRLSPLPPRWVAAACARGARPLRAAPWDAPAALGGVLFPPLRPTLPALSCPVGHGPRAPVLPSRDSVVPGPPASAPGVPAAARGGACCLPPPSWRRAAAIFTGCSGSTGHRALPGGETSHGSCRACALGTCSRAGRVPASPGATAASRAPFAASSFASPHPRFLLCSFRPTAGALGRSDRRAGGWTVHGPRRGSRWPGRVWSPRLCTTPGPFPRGFGPAVPCFSFHGNRSRTSQARLPPSPSLCACPPAADHSHLQAAAAETRPRD